VDAKKQLYYLLEHYYKGEYTTETFADEFSRIYNLETDYRLLSDIEYKLMNELSDITERFSPFEADFENYPNVYFSEQDVKNKATEVYQKLVKA